jgi:hypothetical protein
LSSQLATLGRHARRVVMGPASISVREFPVRSQVIVRRRSFQISRLSVDGLRCRLVEVIRTYLLLSVASGGECGNGAKGECECEQPESFHVFLL